MPKLIPIFYALCVAIVFYCAYKGLPEEMAIRIINGWGFIAVIGMLLHIYDAIKEKK